MSVKLLDSVPLISIITVCYNSVEFIEQAIKSVANQDFDDYEYIIIDGGSSDGTVEIIQNYQDNLAYWHSKPDRGISHAFNLGLEHASGEWVVFLNADDYLASNTVLREMSVYLSQYNQHDVVYGQIQLVSRGKAAQPVSDLTGGAFSWSVLRRKQNIPHPAAFNARSYFDRVGLFDESFRIAMDYEHYLRLGRNLKAQFVPLLVSEMREGGISKQSARASLYEGYLAQVKTRALSKGLAVILFYAHLMASRLSSVRENVSRNISTKVEK